MVVPDSGLATVDVMTPIVIYTDGSCFHNGSRNAFGGIGVFFGDDHPLNIGQCVRGGKITNQTMELHAIVAALNAVSNLKLPPPDGVVLYTDSMYAINCLTKWVNGWENNGWRTKNKRPVQNIDLLKAARELSLKVNAQFVHVPAHGSEPDVGTQAHDHWHGNMCADNLATQAAKEGARAGCRIQRGVVVPTSELLNG